MATPKRINGKMSAALKKAATILTTTGFFAAAVFLAAILWLPANAAPPSAAMDVQTSMLLALDKPERPAPKMHLRDLSSLTDEDADMLANLPPTDLAADLNSWTYTQSSTQDAFSQLYVNYILSGQHNIPIFNAIAAFQDAYFTFLLGILQGLPPNPFILAAINFIEHFALPTLSPYK